MNKTLCTGKNVHNYEGLWGHSPINKINVRLMGGAETGGELSRFPREALTMDRGFT